MTNEEFLQTKIDETMELIPVRDTTNGIKIRMGREYSPWAYTNGDKARMLLNMIAFYLKHRNEKYPATVVGGMAKDSPYQPMCASTCYHLSEGLDYKVNNVFVSACRPENHNEYLSVATKFGASQIQIKGGIGDGLQSTINKKASEIDGSMYVPYAITPVTKISRDRFSEQHGGVACSEYFADMYAVGARQVMALKGTGIKKIYIPFGSANSSTSLVYGLNKYFKFHEVEEVVFVCVGKDAGRQRGILEANLRAIFDVDSDVEFSTLHPSPYSPLFGDGGEDGLTSNIKFTYIDTSKENMELGELSWNYSDKQKESFVVDGVEYPHHYTYEGKAWAKMRELWPEELTNSANLFWEIGGPLLP